MAFHCGAPTREGSSCQRHVRAVGMRCFQHAETARAPGTRGQAESRAAKGRVESGSQGIVVPAATQDPLEVVYQHPTKTPAEPSATATVAPAESETPATATPETAPAKTTAATTAGFADRVGPATGDEPWRPVVAENARSVRAAATAAAGPADPPAAAAGTGEAQPVGGEPDMDVVTPSTELPRRKRVVPRRDSPELHVVAGDGSDEGIYLDLRPEVLERGPEDQGPDAEVIRPRFRAVAAWREAPRDLSRFSDLLGMRDPRAVGGRPPEPDEPPVSEDWFQRVDEDPSLDPFAQPEAGRQVVGRPRLDHGAPDDPAPDLPAPDYPGLDYPVTDSRPTREYTERAEWLETTPERIQSARSPVSLPLVDYTTPEPAAEWATPRPAGPTEEYLVRAEQLEWLPERITVSRPPAPDPSGPDLEQDAEREQERERPEPLPGWLTPAQLPEYQTRSGRIEVEWLPDEEPLPPAGPRGDRDEVHDEARDQIRSLDLDDDLDISRGDDLGLDDDLDDGWPAAPTPPMSPMSPPPPTPRTPRTPPRTTPFLTPATLYRLDPDEDEDLYPAPVPRARTPEEESRAALGDLDRLHDADTDAFDDVPFVGLEIVDDSHLYDDADDWPPRAPVPRRPPLAPPLAPPISPAPPSAPPLAPPLAPPPVPPRLVTGPLEAELNIFAMLRDDEDIPVIEVPGTGDDLNVPEFLVPGFGQTAPNPAGETPLGIALSAVLGPELWRRCHVEWSPAHCVALARLAREVDGLAPSASTSLKSTAGAGLRWLGMTREEDELAARIGDAIEFPDRTSQTIQARTLRMYGVAICSAFGRSTRRCACHRDLMRDVTPETVQEWLDGLLAREV